MQDNTKPKLIVEISSGPLSPIDENSELNCQDSPICYKRKPSSTVSLCCDISQYPKEEIYLTTTEILLKDNSALETDNS